MCSFRIYSDVKCVIFSVLCNLCISGNRTEMDFVYRRTSMARASLGPWEVVPEVDSSGRWVLVVASVQG